MKYKKKYIDYKNNLLALSGKKNALIGGGIDAQIAFLDGIFIRVSYNDKSGPKVVKYRIIKKVGSGVSGTVYSLEQIEPHLPPGSNNSFVIKLTMLVDDKVHGYNKQEGYSLDFLKVEERVKAIYQGRNGIIDFAIYKYLGENLESFFKKSDITGKTLLSLIQQLHTQLYTLNSNDTFHNDVKMQNIVVHEVSGNLELSLIDYGNLTRTHSQRGTTHSMCIRGCAEFLLGSKPPLNAELQQLVRALLPKATSTDYVGFFNVIICMLNSTFCAWDIYRVVLQIDTSYTTNNLLNILCLLCYVSNSAECDGFLGNPTCISIVEKINRILNIHTQYDDNTVLFRDFIPGGDMPVHTQRRILFLSYLYYIITITDMSIYATFVHITKLPKLLWDLSSCLDLQFNLKDFNASFGTIFNEQLLVPLPPPAPSQHPLPAPPSSPQTVEKGNDISKFFN
jgi:hypothetical protein